jgi:ornithine carbamoyltransferase
MMKKDFISLKDLPVKEIHRLLELTQKLKKKKNLYGNLLKNKTIGLVFQKPSNRTRVSFEVGVRQLGGNAIYLGPDEINLGVRETTADVARTLSRYLDGIVARTNTHADILDLAKYASVPIINGLSNMYHPCQGLADIFSIKESLGKFKGVNTAYIGDGNNNVCHSLMIGCAKVGINLSIASPRGYVPRPDVMALAQSFAEDSGARLSISESPPLAVEGADVIYSDVWVSMGQENETQQRLSDFQGFQINDDLLKSANKNYIFMHCLPAHRGEEVTNEIIESKHSIVFDQAENRLHAQKAIFVYLYGERNKK